MNDENKTDPKMFLQSNKNNVIDLIKQQFKPIRINFYSRVWILQEGIWKYCIFLWIFSL